MSAVQFTILSITADKCCIVGNSTVAVAKQQPVIQTDESKKTEKTSLCHMPQI